MRLAREPGDTPAEPDLVVTQDATNLDFVAASLREHFVITEAFPIDRTIPGRLPEILIPVANQEPEWRDPSPVPSTEALGGAKELIPPSIRICWATRPVRPAVVNGGE